MVRSNLKEADLSSEQELEGTTLAVYLFAVRTGRPIGTRDVQRNLGLSSGSVAYRHLQKLTALGLLSQTESGEYVLKGKAKIRGSTWIGHRLVPRTLVYGFFFLTILAMEIAVLAVHFGVENYEFTVFFILITVITAVAMTLFMAEGILRYLRRRTAS